MISIVIPTKDGGSLFRACLAGIAAQEVDEEVEIIVIDSGSADGTPELAEGLGAQVHRIPPEKFSHGGTRNLGARLARAKTIVFAVQDARPLGPDWLAALVAPLRSPDGPAATYSRQIPRPAAPAHQRIYVEYRFGPAPRTQRVDGPEGLDVRSTQFSNVASATTVQLLREFPFADDIVVGEDGEWCARILLAGHSVTYVPESVVEHSHDYPPREAFRRYFDLGASAERTFLSAGRSAAPDVRHEGVAFVRSEIAELWATGERAGIAAALAHEMMRYAGFQLGRRHRIVPARLRPRLSRTPGYWQGNLR